MRFLPRKRQLKPLERLCRNIEGDRGGLTGLTAAPSPHQPTDDSQENPAMKRDA